MAILSLEPPRAAASTSSSARPSRSTWRRASTRRSACCSTSRPTISTATAPSRPMPRSRSAWSPIPATAVIAVDDKPSQAIADRLARAGKRVVRVSARRPLADGVYASGGEIIAVADGASTRVAEPCRHRLAARRAQRPERRGGRRRRPRARVSTSRPSSRGLQELPRPGAPHGGGRPPRPRALRQRFQGDQCRCRRQGAGELRADLLDRRRPAEGGRHHARSPTSSRASPRPI